MTGLKNVPGYQALSCDRLSHWRGEIVLQSPASERPVPVNPEAAVQGMRPQDRETAEPDIHDSGGLIWSRKYSHSMHNPGHAPDVRQIHELIDNRQLCIRELLICSFQDCNIHRRCT